MPEKKRLIIGKYMAGDMKVSLTCSNGIEPRTVTLPT